ncbi:hypothetical protein IWW57_006184, partial [Coemansia sp. S610]
VLNLREVTLIDPKADLAGALRQVDHIFYTLSVNQKEHAERVAELRKEYKTQVRLLKVSKAATKKKSKTRSKVVVPAAPAAEPAAAEPKEGEDDAAVVAEKIFRLEQELNAKIAELDTKYVLEFEMPPLMLGHSTSPELLQQTNDMVKRGELAGRLVKRVSWVPLEFGDLPDPGDFDIGEVMKSPYFFS